MNEVARTLDRVATGIAGVDVILNGGFFKGGIYLLQGTPGTGKTTFANQLCFHRIEQGDRALYVTLLAEYHARMVQYVGRMSFFDESKIPDHLSYVSGFKTLRSDGIAALLTLIRREILARKVSLIIVDGLIAAQRAAESAQAFNEFVHELQGIALSTDCTMLLVASADRDNRASTDHTMVDGIIELSDQGFGWASERAIQVTKIRGSSYLRGKHSYKITDDGLVIYPRLEALADSPNVTDPIDTDRITSGNAQLDTIVGGGLPARSPTMLAGPSGVGKTTFGLHFLAACSEDEPGLLMGFYETAPRIKAKAQAVCQALLPRLDSGIVEMLWQPPMGDSLDAYAQRLLDAVRRRGVRRLFLDGLGAFKSAPDAEHRIRQFLPALTNELRAQGVSTIYSLEAGNTVGTSAPIIFSDLSAFTENLVLLRYVERGATLHRLISILKMRDSDFDPFLHEFILTDQGPQIDSSTRSAEQILSAHSALDAMTMQSPHVE